jgi:tetratricopeptide (TPR) repeat protein
MVFALCAILTLPAMAQQQPRMSVETSQSLFSVMAAINVCGYDADLAQSIPLRQQIRGEVLQAAQSRDAQSALRNMCAFYEDHLQDNASRTLSNYVSLGLNMADSPKLELRTKESDLPPDAIFVLGFLPLLQRFNEAANLNAIWLRHRPDYDQLIRNLHKPINDTLLSTDIYLKRNLSGYIKHEFVVYVEPLAAPGEVNSRNYAEDYYMVISPTAAGAVRLDQVRHTYLHYILDAKVLSRGTTLERLSPLLDSVKRAPLEDSYRFDIGLLLTESLIKAIEARLLGELKGPDKPKEQLAWDSTRQGFILTRYFYDKLVAFERDEVGFDQSYADWLHDINVEQQQKIAATIPFLQSATPELVRKSQRKEMLVDLAERALASGNFDGAQNYAQQALRNQEDPGRALFVLARVAIADGKLDDAQGYFERAAAASSDSKIRGWSHIYLGRILDMQEHRQEAVEHYRAALNAGGSSELKAAAEKGLQQAYQPPVKHPND